MSNNEIYFEASDACYFIDMLVLCTVCAVVGLRTSNALINIFHSFIPFHSHAVCFAVDACRYAYVVYCAWARHAHKSLYTHNSRLCPRCPTEQINCRGLSLYE